MLVSKGENQLCYIFNNFSMVVGISPIYVISKPQTLSLSYASDLEALREDYEKVRNDFNIAFNKVKELYDSE